MPSFKLKSNVEQYVMIANKDRIRSLGLAKAEEINKQYEDDEMDR